MPEEVERTWASEYDWDFFIAHSSADTDAAELLYDGLVNPRGWPEHPVRVFLDSRSLKLGDDWDVALPRAQRRSLVTVVLVSARTQAAYYQREEVAAAIAMARESGSRHRVVPVFFGKAGQGAIPYGLRLKHGLKVEDASGLRVAAFNLLALLNDIREIPARIMSARVGAVEEDSGSSQVSLKTIAESASRGAAAINAFVKALEDVFRAGARTLDFLSDRRERLRLRRLLRHLADIEYDQAPLPWLLRGYERSDQRNWDQITSTIAILTPTVAEAIELLATLDGPFTVSARDAHKSLLFGLRARSEVYAAIHALNRPAAPQDYIYLKEIAEHYQRMASDLRHAQDAIARYLSE